MNYYLNSFSWEMYVLQRCTDITEKEKIIFKFLLF